MPIDIEGKTYHYAEDVRALVGVSRQTLWRWRRTGVIPSGQRLRDRRMVFSDDEVQAIRAYATRILPAPLARPEDRLRPEAPNSQQLKLFDERGK
jgi:predicted DNA-binding transcriptional regulator AlpA